jgi:hypothetical protein
MLIGWFYFLPSGECEVKSSLIMVAVLLPVEKIFALRIFSHLDSLLSNRASSFSRCFSDANLLILISLQSVCVKNRLITVSILSQVGLSGRKLPSSYPPGKAGAFAHSDSGRMSRKLQQ